MPAVIEAFSEAFTTAPSRTFAFTFLLILFTITVAPTAPPDELWDPEPSSVVSLCFEKEPPIFITDVLSEALRSSFIEIEFLSFKPDLSLTVEIFPSPALTLTVLALTLELPI